MGIGGNIYVDYLLPIGVPLSLGFEAGVDTATFITKYSGWKDFTDTVTAIPLLLRVAYHLDLNPKLDLYLVGKIGYVIGIWDGELKKELKNFYGDFKIEEKGGIGFGFDIGAAWYFTSNFGIFAEAGFDRYDLSVEMSGTLNGQDTTETFKSPFSRFLTAGISLKF